MMSPSTRSTFVLKNRVQAWYEPALGNTLFLDAHYRDQRFDRHFHEEFAIGITDSGCQAFVYDQRTRLDMPAGSVALIAPGIVHSGWPGVEDGWRYRMLYPASQLVHRTIEDVFDARAVGSFHRPVVNDVWLSAAFARLHTLSRSAENPALEIESLFHAIIRRAFGEHAGQRAPSRALRADRRRVAPMRDAIEARYDCGVTLEELARQAGLSRFQALRHFRAIYGLPPHAFLRHVRVRVAHRLIRAGESLAEAALAAGFSDQAHMTRAFRQTVGYTPGALAQA